MLIRRFSIVTTMMILDFFYNSNKNQTTKSTSLLLTSNHTSYYHNNNHFLNKYHYYPSLYNNMNIIVFLIIIVISSSFYYFFCHFSNNLVSACNNNNNNINNNINKHNNNKSNDITSSFSLSYSKLKKPMIHLKQSSSVITSSNRHQRIGNGWLFQRNWFQYPRSIYQTSKALSIPITNVDTSNDSLNHRKRSSSNKIQTRNYNNQRRRNRNNKNYIQQHTNNNMMSYHSKASSLNTFAYISSWWNNDKQQQQQDVDDQKDKNIFKKITFIRHGCTYMNEYLGGADGGKSFGAPYFTDIFTNPIQYNKYHDTKLSPYGIKQVNKVLKNNQSNDSKLLSVLRQCDLILISPLTRALQTYDIGIKSHIDHINQLKQKQNQELSSSSSSSSGSIPPTSLSPPIIAVPQAAERLYLISDVGSSISELQKDHPYVDFITAFISYKQQKEQQKHQQQVQDSSHNSNNTNDNDNDDDNTGHNRVTDDVWWYQPSSSSYIEWRPIDNNQIYACPGESMNEFNNRMNLLYEYIESRSEQNIIVVCHHGVIEWFLHMDFDNCQYRTIDFHKIKPKNILMENINIQPHNTILDT